MPRVPQISPIGTTLAKKSSSLVKIVFSEPLKHHCQKVQFTYTN